MVQLFTIEGNIGSGKSTLISKLTKYNHIVFLPEPVDIWNTICDSAGITILENFYKDPQAYAFSFQMMAYISRLSLLRKAMHTNPNAIIITERSIWTDRYIFAKMLYDDHKINNIDYSIYLKWFDEFITDIQLAGIIYVKTNPHICQERIARRNRKGETISLDYSINCHKYHEEWLTSSNTPILTLDGNTHYHETMPKEWDKQIMDFINIHTYNMAHLPRHTSPSGRGRLSQSTY